MQADHRAEMASSSEEAEKRSMEQYKELVEKHLGM